LQDYEFECIRRIDESNDEIASLVKLIYAKTSVDDSFLNYLTQLRSSDNKHELEAIRRLILYEYKSSSTSNYINKIIRLKDGSQIKLSKILSFGIHTIVFDASDQASKSFILKVLHPKFYNTESSSFKERHDKQKSLSKGGSGIAEVYDIVNIPKNEIIIVKICKYDKDLRSYVLNNSDEKDYYELIGNIFINLCATVKILHNKGVAHRDIAPSNIFVNNKKNIFLGDFDNIFINGSTDSEEDVRYRSKKDDGIFFDVFIDPNYISKLNNGGKFSCTFEEAKEVDLYSLCVTLLFCILRTRFSNNIELINFLKDRPGGESNNMKLFAIDIMEFTDFPNKINDRLKEFFQKGLNRNEKERFKNIDDLINAFNTIKNELKPTSIPNISGLKLYLFSN
jgi:serine/threonine protein kinase